MREDKQQQRSRAEKKMGRRKGDGIIKRKGHETTIGLELALGKGSSGEVEVSYRRAVHTTKFQKINTIANSRSLLCKSPTITRQTQEMCSNKDQREQKILRRVSPFGQ
jgi:hypothetical protein